MRYCPFCGAPRELEKSLFCMKCGSRFPAPDAEYIAEAAAAKDDEGSSGNKKLIIIDAILAVLIIAMGVLLLTGVFSA